MAMMIHLMGDLIVCLKEDGNVKMVVLGTLILVLNFVEMVLIMESMNVMMEIILMEMVVMPHE